MEARREALRSQPFSKMIEAATAEELIDRAFREAMKAGADIPERAPPIVKARRREEARVRKAASIISRHLRKLLKRTPSLERISPFYASLLELVASKERVKQALKKLARTMRIVGEIERESIRKIRRVQDPLEAAKIRKAAFGRMASLLRDADEELALLREIRTKLKDVPSIDVEKPAAIIAGYPGVGKSTIVRGISTAKPKIGNYPFTTKEIILGHLKLKDDLMLQVVDTPGLLDRPLSERNRIELQAIAALKHLKGVIVFVVDAAEANGFTLEQQCSLLCEIKRMFPEKPVITVLNKVDLATKDKLERAYKLFEKIDLETVASEGIGLRELLNLVIKTLGLS